LESLKDAHSPLAVKLIQESLKRKGLYLGEIDGDPGGSNGKTRKAFKKVIAATAPVRGRAGVTGATGTAGLIAKIASGEIGTREVGNNAGKDIVEYQEATWLQPGAWPWCAAFVCWVLREVSNQTTVPWRRPRTAGAWDFEKWATDRSGAGVELIKPRSRGKIKKGDILVYTFSHIGIAVADEKNSSVATVEGNTNKAGSREGDGVYKKTRKTSLVRSIVRAS
jgi:hypothetical protein